jgi:hypothetical protein
MKKNYSITLSFAFLFLAIQIQAQIYVNSNASGLNNGASWGNAYTSLQDALAAANFGNEIWVAQGTYYPDDGAGLTDNDRNATFQLKNGVALYGGFTGTETMLSQRNWKTNITILSGDIIQSNSFIINSYTVVTGSGTDATAIIDGFTIMMGDADNVFQGGGLYNNGGSPTIRNNKFLNNRAQIGGGVYNQNSSSPRIVNCLFSGNWAIFGGGGGMLNQAGSSALIINCVFSGNLADRGSGIYNENSSSIIINVTITGNTAVDSGGAIYNASSNPTITNTILWNNTANGSTTTASASVFNENSNPTFNHNLIANSGGSASWDTAIGTDNGSNIATDPQLNDANNADFRLQFVSPAINAGTPDVTGLNLPAEDFVGDPRIIDGIIDIGALEFQGVQPIAPGTGNILYVDQSAVSGNQSGDSWENAALQLRDALTWAANSWDGSNAPLQIWVAKGMYLPTGDSTDRNAFFQLVNNVEIYGGFFGNETDLNQRNFSTHETILSGDIDADETLQNNSHTILNGSGTDTTALIDGFTVSGGNADGATTITGRGAGMYNDAGSPTVSSCKFSGNSAIFGGGVYNFNNSSPTITNSRFMNNSASASGGGVLNINSSPTILNALLVGNSADNGGGMFNDNNSSAVVTNTTFSENTAVFNGGALFNGNSNLILTNVIIWNNTANGITTSASSSVFNIASSPVISYSLVANSGGSVSWDSSLGTDNGNNIDVDPVFEDSANGDFALNPNSPAKNVGTPDTTGLNLPSEDLAGNSRIFDGTIDMGAFENQLTCPAANVIYVSASATGNNLGTSWADAYTDLQNALDNNCAGVTEIWVAAGTYKPSKNPANCNGCNSSRDNTFQLKDGIALYGGFNGTETLLSERDFENNITILSGDYNDDDTVTGSGDTLFINNNNENAYHVVLAAFPFNDTNSSTRLDGFTVKSGNANIGELIGINGLTFSKRNGGGIYTLYGNNTIVNNKIEVCEADFWGGGIFLNRGINNLSNNTISTNIGNVGGGVNILFGSNTFSSNTITNNATLNPGGGMYFNDSNSTLTDNIITMNTTFTAGGGIYFDEGTYQLSGNLIENNSSALGGGIYFKTGNNTLINNQINNNEAIFGGGILSGTISGEDLPDNGTFIFTGNTISGNSSINVGGGALLSRGNYTFTNNTISNNTSEEGGGGFAIENATTIFDENNISSNSLDATSGIAGGGIIFLNSTNTLSKNTIADNSANNAAGILFQGGTNNLTGNRFRGNTATLEAGGIFIFQGTNTLINNSFSNNTAATGGGIYLEEGTNTLVNNSITGNTANTNGGGIYNLNSNPSITNNIIWDNTANGSAITASASIFNENSTPTFSHNLIANSGGSASWDSSLGTDSGNNIDLDPLFVDIATNDFSLQKGSLAINAGNNTAYQTATGNNPASDTDINGNARLFQSTIDMGAFEADFNQSQWRGTTSEDWSTNTNWDEGVPDDQSVALIRDISLNTPKIDAPTNAEVSDLILAQNAALNVQGVLKVNAEIQNNGQVTFTSNEMKTGQLDEFSGTYSGTGTVEVERFIPAGDNDKRAFRFLSSSVNSTGSINTNWQEGAATWSENPNPGFGTHITGSLAGANGFDASGSGNPSLFLYPSAAQTWSSIANTDVKTLEAGAAYRLMVRGDRSIDLTSNAADPTNTILRSKGSLVFGTIDMSSELAQGADQFSLVGNPYQSVVDFSAVNKNNLRDYVYVWDASLTGANGRGAYVIVEVSSNSIVEAPAASSSSATKFIAPNQAFFVRNTDAGSPTLVFEETNKATTQAQVEVFSTYADFYINSRLYKIEDLQNGNTEVDALGLRFNQNFTTLADEEDAEKLTNPDENYAIINNGLRVIDKQNLPTDGHEIELFINSYTTTAYSLTFAMDNLPEEIEVFLNDTYLNTQTELLLQSTYDFTVDANIPASMAFNRFSLSFDHTTLGVEDNVFSNLVYTQIQQQMANSPYKPKVSTRIPQC